MGAKQSKLASDSFDEAIVNDYGKDYLSLFLWAKERDVLETLDLVYHSFGLSPRHVDPHRIIKEITLPFGEKILSEWVDNEIARSLYDYYLELANTPDIFNKVEFLPRVASADKAKRDAGDYTNSSYLLALSYSSPFQGKYSKSAYYQTMLRIWCYLHGMYWSKAEGRHDSVLSRVARYLIIDRADGNKIELLDVFFEELDKKLSQCDINFYLCNFYIGEVAGFLSRQRSRDLDQGQKNFLTNLTRIARYDIELIGDVPQGKISSPKFLIQKLKNTSSANEVIRLFDQSGMAYSEEYAIEESEVSDEDVGFLNIEISPEQTDAEQIVISRGVFIQRAEQAHYLPWSWDKVLPPEIPLLEDWLNKRLASIDISESLAAAIIWIAQEYGRSLDTVLMLEIKESATAEWTLDPSFHSIRRMAIRRHSAYRPKKRAQPWLKAVADQIEIQLPNRISAVLQRASESMMGEPKQLSQLWSAHHKSSLFKWFNQSKPSELERLRSSMIANSLGQKIFNHTSDTAFSRAWSSYPQNALPAACGYGSWDIDELLQGETPTKSVTRTPQTSYLGSMLLPLDEPLKAYSHELKRYVERAGSFREFHNSLAYYTVQGLYAALGSRYLVDPFESLIQFYFSSSESNIPSCVFINDKQDDIHSGRLVPLCDQAEKLLKDYLVHLNHLMEKVSELSPNFALQIARLLESKPAQMPLFFFLDEKLQWRSMSELELLKELPTIPLPNNVYRHRFSQRMTELGLPSDILEAWMGHGERGVASYGDFSPRCWQEDALNFMELLNSSFEKLDFQSIVHQNTSLPLGFIGAEITTTLNTEDAVLFGETARSIRRKQTIEAIKEITLHKIGEVLGGREWSVIAEDEFEEIVTKLFKPENNTISLSYPLERMEVLRDSLIKAGSPLIRLIKKRQISLKQERNLLNKSALQALRLLPAIKDWAAQNCEVYPSSLSLKQSAQLGVILFAIEKQISYLGLLKDIADGVNYQLIQHGRECFLRYSEELDDEDLTSAGQLHRISYKVASLLNAAKNSKHNLKARESIAHKSLNVLGHIIGLPDPDDFDDLLKSLSGIIEQANMVVLPGVVAAGLSHRQPPSSLSLHDFLRISLRNPVVPVAPLAEEKVKEFQQLMPVSTQWMSAADSQLKKESDKFHKEINNILSQYENSKARDCAKQIINVSKSYSGKISTAVLGVGYWIAHIVSVGKYQGQRKNFSPLAQSTIVTYFGTLIVAFKELAYNRDIFTLSEEEFYELYEQMLDYKREKDNETEYFGNRLRSYHKFLLNQGLPELNWGELDFKDYSRDVSSGLITEKDYQETLKYIDKKYADKEQVALLQFVLLLGFRFGLRAQEATHLLKKDWNESNGKVWVLVRNNRYRTLKSENGRRAIPLLFELSEIERSAIKVVFERSEINAGSDIDQLILSEVRSGEIVLNPLCYSASRELIVALREVTGNPQLVLHHARHSFHNQLVAILCGINSPLITKLTKSLDAEQILSTLLEVNNLVDRRASMAVAVMMGHAHPATSLKSYNHLITEWADTLLPVAKTKIHELETAIQLDSWEKWKAPKIESVARIDFVKPTLHNLVQLMRLVALGKSFSQAINMLGMHPKHAVLLEQLAVKAFVKSSANLPAEIDSATLLEAREFLSHISESAWLRLLSCCDKEFTFQGKVNISLQDIPLLVGNKRQILMCEDPHYELMRTLIEYFDLSSDSYGVSLYQDSQVAAEKAKLYGLGGIQDQGKQIDVMHWYMADQTLAPHRNYAAFWLKDRLSTTEIRSSYEVVLVVILISYFFHCG